METRGSPEYRDSGRRTSAFNAAGIQKVGTTFWLGHLAHLLAAARVLGGFRPRVRVLGLAEQVLPKLGHLGRKRVQTRAVKPLRLGQDLGLLLADVVLDR